MTRTKTIATLWCTALVATLAAYGCGSSSTIDTGTGGSPGTAGRAGGAGGGVVIITNTGGATGTGGRPAGAGGMTGGGTGGMVQPPVDAGPPACNPNNMCTAPFMCDGMCRANGMNGTRTCTCDMNGRLACTPCITPDAGAPPPPVDAGPRPDAGLNCAGNVANNRPCAPGTASCTRMAGGNLQTCTCVDVPDAGADAAAAARYMCM